MSTRAKLFCIAVVLLLSLAFISIGAVSLVAIHQPDTLLTLSGVVGVDISTFWAQINIDPIQVIAGECTTASGNSCGS